MEIESIGPWSCFVFLGWFQMSTFIYLPFLTSYVVGCNHRSWVIYGFLLIVDISTSTHHSFFMLYNSHFLFSSSFLENHVKLFWVYAYLKAFSYIFSEVINKIYFAKCEIRKQYFLFKNNLVYDIEQNQVFDSLKYVTQFNRSNNPWVLLEFRTTNCKPQTHTLRIYLRKCIRDSWFCTLAIMYYY